MELVAHSFCCFFMTGLIWTIQLVHYPAFERVDESRFKEFTAFHSARITWIVGPVMLVELATAVGLWRSSPTPFWTTNLILLALIWVCTYLWSVRYHNRLAFGKSSVDIRSLVLTNWPRTALWTARSAMLLTATGFGGAS